MRGGFKSCKLEGSWGFDKLTAEAGAVLQKKKHSPTLSDPKPRTLQSPDKP